MAINDLLLHLSLLIMSSSGQSNSEIPFICSIESQECQHPSGQIDIVTNVPSIEECRQLCQDHDQCQFITYYYPDGFPGYKMCILLQGCENLTECTNCESQNMDCFTMGSIAPMVGSLGDNVLDAIQDVDSAVVCKEKCSNWSHCRWFTYFFENDNLFPNVCFLVTEILGPYRVCQNCLSGPKDEECFMLHEGEKHQSLMLTNTSQEHTIFAFGSGSCQLKTLTVGRGGYGNYGGGGSGFLNSLTVSVPSAFMREISVNVGGFANSETTTVRINHEVCVAESGKYGDGNDGGDGYSGGGRGDPGSEGGSNGSKGGGSKGGQGTGEDVTSNQFFAFDVSPGRGGGSYDMFGGGGGGVLVNGIGPGEDPYNGEGYGGGAGYLSTEPRSGVVLMEVFN